MCNILVFKPNLQHHQSKLICGWLSLENTKINLGSLSAALGLLMGHQGA